MKSEARRPLRIWFSVRRAPSTICARFAARSQASASLTAPAARKSRRQAIDSEVLLDRNIGHLKLPSVTEVADGLRRRPRRR